MSRFRQLTVLAVAIVVMLGTVLLTALVADRFAAGQPSPILPTDQVRTGALAGTGHELLRTGPVGTVSVIADQVSVVDGSGSGFGIVVFNGTDAMVYGAEVHYDALDRSGTVVGTIETTSAQPTMIPPGGHGLLYGLPYGVVIAEGVTIQPPVVTWATEADLVPAAGLDVASLATGGDGVDVVLANGGDLPVWFVLATAVCLNASGDVTDGMVVPLTGVNPLDPGATASLWIEADRFRDGTPCQHLLVAAGGTLYRDAGTPVATPLATPGLHGELATPLATPSPQ